MPSARWSACSCRPLGGRLAHAVRRGRCLSCPARSGGPGRSPWTSASSSSFGGRTGVGVLAAFLPGRPTYGSPRAPSDGPAPTGISPAGLTGCLSAGRWDGRCAWPFVGRLSLDKKNLEVPADSEPPCAAPNRLRDGGVRRVRACDGRRPKWKRCPPRLGEKQVGVAGRPPARHTVGTVACRGCWHRCHAPLARLRARFPIESRRRHPQRPWHATDAGVGATRR
ncbi:hypothetical protein BOBR111200_06120 [Bordetella bronchialis]